MESQKVYFWSEEMQPILYSVSESAQVLLFECEIKLIDENNNFLDINFGENGTYKGDDTDEIINEFVNCVYNQNHMPIYVNLLLNRLIMSIYSVTERELFNVLASPNGVFICGTNTTQQDIKIDISNISFHLKDKYEYQNNELFNEFYYTSYYVEQPFDVDTLYESKQDEFLEYGEFVLKAGRYFKIWFFPKEPQPLDLRMYAREVCVSFSLRSDQNIRVLFGVSNTDTYTQISHNIDLTSKNEWEKFDFSLIENFSVETENSYISSIVNFVRLNCNRRITRNEIAEYIHLHPSYLSKLFKQNMGVTIGEYVTAVRITKAKKLLRETKLTIEEIAEEIGFYDNHHLQKAFKKAVGCTPGRYRAQKDFDE